MASPELNIRVQPADMDAAKEFSTIISSVTDAKQFAAVVASLAARTDQIRAIYAQREWLEKEDLVKSVLEWSSLPRRIRKELLAELDVEELYGPISRFGDVETVPLDRIAATSESLRLAPLRDLGWEVMHFLDPFGVPLCSQWVFNRETETGALALLVNEEYDLFGSDDIQQYHQVAFAYDYLGQALAAGGHNPFGEGPYAMDSYLAMVYGIYMSTVLEMRMTKEFIKILPPLIDVAKRLLGVKGEAKCP